MKSAFLIAMALTFGWIAHSSALANNASAQTAPRITLVASATFANVQVPGRYIDIVQGISEFAAGEAARTNSAPASPRFFTVLEGTVTVTVGDKTDVFSAGANWTVPAGIYFGIRNDLPSRARVFFSVLSGPGATGPQPQPGSVIPTNPSRILQQVRTSVYVSSDVINLQQVIQEWEPGARNSPHTMNHPHLISMLEGENTNRYLDGEADRMTPGMAGVMAVGRPGIMENTGSTTNRLYFTWVATPGTPTTSPYAAPAPVAASSVPVATTAIAPPRTGDGELASSRDEGESSLVVLAKLALVAGVVGGSITYRALWLKRN